jgi:hypothetical protein
MYLRSGFITTDARLDRLPSKTDEHIQKYPLSALEALPTKTAMTMGVNWYANFDRPVVKTINGLRRYVIGDGGYLGLPRGGHATALRPWGVVDLSGWYHYYNQGVEGRCVEFGMLRMMSLLNRRRYDITSRWHYWEAQKIDEWDGGSYPDAHPEYEGTSVRAGLEVLRLHGAIKSKAGGALVTPEEIPLRLSHAHGISAYRWATSWDEVRQVLGVPDWLPGVPVLNSWGDAYPREVILLDGTGERLLREDGEFGVATDH